MKKFISLIALTALLLVPYGWVAELSPPLEYLFDEVFKSQLAHLVGHSLIFALIGGVALHLFPVLHERPAAYLALILLAALGQEGLQMMVSTRLNLDDSVRDILVDLLAAVGVWLLLRMRGARAGLEGVPPP